MCLRASAPCHEPRCGGGHVSVGCSIAPLTRTIVVIAPGVGEHAELSKSLSYGDVFQHP